MTEVIKNDENEINKNQIYVYKCVELNSIHSECNHFLAISDKR